MLPRYIRRDIGPQPLLQHKFMLLSVLSEDVQPHPAQTEPGCCMTLSGDGMTSRALASPRRMQCLFFQRNQYSQLPDPIKTPDLVQILTAFSLCKETSGSSLVRSCVTPVKPC